MKPLSKMIGSGEWQSIRSFGQGKPDLFQRPDRPIASGGLAFLLDGLLEHICYTYRFSMLDRSWSCTSILPTS